MHDALRIALEAGLPFTGLRDFQVDPRMWHYVPLTVAIRERIVPMIVIGDALTIAAAHPDPDLSSLRTHFPNLTVSLVIAAPEELDAVLQRAQGAEA